jgi:hypothetical protein
MSVLSPHRYAQRIADLIALGLTHEKIAHRLAMSPANVGKIARQLGAETPAADRPPGYDPRNLRRCPGCGGMVYLWPCLACGGEDAE